MCRVAVRSTDDCGSALIVTTGATLQELAEATRECGISQEDLLVLGLCQPYHLVLLAQGDEPVSLVDFLGDYPNILEFVFAEAPEDADDRKSWGVLRGVQITADPPNMVQ